MVKRWSNGDQTAVRPHYAPAHRAAVNIREQADRPELRPPLRLVDSGGGGGGHGVEGEAGQAHGVVGDSVGWWAEKLAGRRCSSRGWILLSARRAAQANWLSLQKSLSSMQQKGWLHRAPKQSVIGDI